MGNERAPERVGDVPRADAAEDALAGAAILDNTLFTGLGIKPEEFYQRDLRKLWREGQELVQQGHAVDQVTLSLETLNAVGGAARLMNLVNAVPSVMRAPDYAREVHDAAEGRRMLRAADWLARAAFKGAEERAEAAGKAKTRLQHIEADWRIWTGQAPLEVLSADTILSTDWPEPVWAVPNLLPRGLAILAGKPKLGKSWLALQIALAVASGGRFLGETVEPGSVLYLALEDPPPRLKDRMRKQRWPLGLPVDFLSMGEFVERVGNLRNGGGQRLAAQIAKREYRLVVIDTLSRSVSGDQNSVEAMTEALTPVQEMSHEFNCAVLMVDHHRKGFGADPDAICDILGSTAKGAMADTILGLYRERGKSGAQLAVISRETEERQLTIKVDWATGSWYLEAEEGALELTEGRQDVLDVLGEMGAVGVAEVAEAVDRNRGSVYRDLQDLVSAALVCRDKDGRNVTYRLVR